MQIVCRKMHSVTCSYYSHIDQVRGFLACFCQKYEFCGAILHEFCKMCAYSVENAAVTGNSELLYIFLRGN